jgi:hypothetical protein
MKFICCTLPKQNFNCFPALGYTLPFIMSKIPNIVSQLVILAVRKLSDGKISLHALQELTLLGRKLRSHSLTLYVKDK